jgi:hypothetical protein
MRWVVLIQDPLYITDEVLPVNVLELISDLKKDGYIDIKFHVDTNKDYGSYINTFLDIRKNYDHTCIVYDGHWSCDGVANQATHSIVYNQAKTTLNHRSSGLIDDYLETEYKEENWNKFITETLYKVLKKFISFEKLPEVLPRIEALKPHFKEG